MKKDLFKKICAAMVLVLALAMFVSDASVAKADDETVTVIFDIRNGTRKHSEEVLPLYEEIVVPKGDNNVESYNIYPNEGYRLLPKITWNGSDYPCPENASLWPAETGWNVEQRNDWLKLGGYNINADATWIIEYQPIEYKIVFDANGGSGNMDPATIKYDAETPLPKCAFTKSGYKCSGWSLEPNGEVVYGNGASVLNLSVEDGEEIIFYAQWTPAPAPVYNVPDTATK